VSSSFDARRALAIALKETHHISRDPVTLTVSLGLPLLLVLFFGFAIDLNVRNVDLLVADGDKTRASRALADLFGASGYFAVRSAPSSEAAVEELGNEKAKAALVIEPGFQRDLIAGRPVSAQILLDGADNAYAGTVSSYLQGVQALAQSRLIGGPEPPARIEPRFLFNPELDSHWFIVPGVIVIVVGLIATLLTALTVAREWENGSMELLLSTPVRPLEIIAGKLSPYLALCFGGMVLVYAMARLVFEVPFVGSLPVFVVATVLFLAATMSQGLVISVVTRQQQLAFQAAMNTGMMPIQLLSGFIFPVESMLAVFQYATVIIPARWYMTIVRALFLRGTDYAMLARPFAALAALTAIFVGFAWRKFKTDLEP
jgi:ABC-2 type transport system permease protein